jgi:methylglutaconyl-CoA hydratase
MSEILQYSVGEGVACIRLNRPDKRNALNGALVRSLKEALRTSAADPDVRAVLLSGAGKDFCSGADLAELERIAGMGMEESRADALSLAELFTLVREHPRPVVAAVQGRALAGGCGLATACDLVLARADARFGYPEVHLGFVPAMVMSILRRKVTESVAFELAVLGERITAARAAEIGLVNRVLPEEGFEGAVEAFMADLASRPPGAVGMTKRLLYDLDGLGLAEGLAVGAEVNARARTSQECRTGVRRFLDRSGSGTETGS